MAVKKRRKKPTIKQKAEDLLKILKLREKKLGKKARFIGRGISGKDLKQVNKEKQW